MRIAIVTGAGGDIGCAIAAAFLEDGYAVLLGDIDGGAARLLRLLRPRSARIPGTANAT